MNNLVQFNIGGVPEHFNLPWHIAMEQELFAKNGISLNWTDYPGGTGAMTKDLREKNLDIAVLLTEGIINDISKGNPCQIISQYVSTPLIWGIHVPASAAYNHIEDIIGKKYAISRLGSGSHIMAYVDATQRGWKISDDQLVVVGDIDGARKAFKNNEAQIFLWEKFMTKPLVDAGECKRIGECPTPWPCFVIAAREEVIKKFPEALKKLVEVINISSTQFMKNEQAADLVSLKYSLKPEDAAEWISKTRWACGEQLLENDFIKVVENLSEIGIIENIPRYEMVCGKI
ncbi:MAG: substrate-binding domain-containing protein [Bacteroidota bacterium]|nr:substrate-binding domain-containing protein [Bacteroidota bacterium]